jgi:hypothetical protein
VVGQLAVIPGQYKYLCRLASSGYSVSLIHSFSAYFYSSTSIETLRCQHFCSASLILHYWTPLSTSCTVSAPAAIVTYHQLITRYDHHRSLTDRYPNRTRTPYTVTIIIRNRVTSTKTLYDNLVSEVRSTVGNIIRYSCDILWFNLTTSLILTKQRIDPFVVSIIDRNGNLQLPLTRLLTNASPRELVEETSFTIR